MKLLFLEIKRIFKSPIFYISLVIIFGFMFMQMDINDIHDEDPALAKKRHEEMVRKAKKEVIDGEEVLVYENSIIYEEAGYGSKKTDDITVVQENSVERLIYEFNENSYATYPFGFYKEIQLSSSEQEQMAKYLSKLTGKSLEEVKKSSTEPEFYEGLNYSTTGKKEFLKIMNLVDDLVGGGSHYSEKKVVSAYGDVPMDYEDAVEDYNIIKNKDKFTGAYARLFCDYLGIIISFAPILLAVFIWYQDKTSGALEIINSKSVGSTKLVLTRVLAMFIVFAFAIFILATIYNVKVISVYGVENVDIFAFYKYILLWILPNLLFVLAFGTLITILTNYPVGIVGMLVLWILFITGNDIAAGYDWPLILRHNTFGNTEFYFNNIGSVFTNRAIYTAVSVVFILLAIKIFDLKRNGGMVRIERVGNNRKKRA
ncbi:MAG: ABC transporter permease [Miniphocaeibacter sp.]|uniref:ABC transporter permease n=1 Tax=Miniphocaeibacter sp. TaxID=3100973 RepID=UPI001804BCD1|nr:ABC transporter permease [Gallicola sp.]